MTPTRWIVARFLGRTWWQGVGAVAGVLSILIGWYAFTGDDTPSTGAKKANNSVRAGDGNCIIQRGSGNTCQLGPARSSAAAEPLSIEREWPVLPGCDGATEVAALTGGRDAAAFHVSPTRDVREDLVDAGGAAYGTGHLTLDFTVTDGSTVQVTGIRPVFFDSHTATPAWVYSPEGGCGDSYSRVFDLDLDRRSMVDRGVVGTPGTDSTPPPAEELGPSFHVSAEDPAQIRIDATTCRAYHEWGVQVSYLVRGKHRTRQIGTAEHPFRSVAAASSPLPRYADPRIRGLRTDALVPDGVAGAPPDCR